MIVACVRFGEAFGVEYVERLYDMVRRNLPDGFGGRFVCLTDRPSDLSHLPRVETQPLSEGLEGWWNKMALFAPGTFPANERIWYFDLDTVITGPLEKLFEYPGHFGILEDVYRPGGFQSSVMSWIAGTKLSNSIWEEWNARGAPSHPLGDQGILETHWREWLPKKLGGKPWPPDFLQSLFPGVLRSYKVDCEWSIPKGTSVVFFHGLPRPHQVLTGWVPEVWKVGGGSPAEIVSVGTVPQEKVLANVRDALSKGYEVLEQGDVNTQLAVICGGGPSIKDQTVLIGSLQAAGAIVFSLNQVDHYLRNIGIRPNLHVMLDARPELKDWVLPGGIKLYASMCDPQVLAEADAVGDLTVWHPITQGITEIVGPALMIGGGETVGTRAMALAYILGFRRIMLVGFDSSYRDGEHHAYSQSLNDGDRILDVICNGKRFRAAPWMVKQTDDFKELAVRLRSMGCEISILGDGLLPEVAASLNEHGVIKIDGFWWPASDHEARSAVIGTLPDLRHYMELCTQRRVVVQAGGNVGVWPLELSRSFAKVYTFEPDPENYACLERNVAGHERIHAYPAALGPRESHTQLMRSDWNCGATALDPEGREGLVPVVALDSLHLDDVDLLQLDIEGYELQALKGSVETINRCSPLIVLELKGHSERYGNTDEETESWLKALGYSRIGVAHRDVIFRRH